jgi:hypothetical protein
MNYLVIKDNTITQVCTSVEDLLEYLEVKIHPRGIIEVGKEEILPMTYNMSEYTVEEVIKDVIKTQLKQIEIILKIGIYKLERI